MRLALLGLLILLPTVARATDQDVFNRLIARLAPPVDLTKPYRPKVGCVCHDPSFEQGLARPGALLTDAMGNVRCGVPGFFPNGSIMNFFFCDLFELAGH